jgi:hypothetical protein
LSGGRENHLRSKLTATWRRKCRRSLYQEAAETQLDLVAKLGLELYAQHHIGEMGEGAED